MIILDYVKKPQEDFFAASYSLLTDVMVYPVLNGSVFYLDDFPSPVPSGDGTYIKRDYGLSIKEFLYKYLVAGYAGAGRGTRCEIYRRYY